MASTKDRQRALERARYQRIQKIQAQRQLERRKRTRIIAVVTAAAVVVVAVIGTALALNSSSTKTPAAAATPSAAASANPSAAPTATASVPAGYAADPSGQTPSMNVGIPTFDAATAAKPYTATIKTNLGDIVFTALTTKAPYTTYSFEYLAQKGFFNNQPCPRISDSQGLFMLQCPDSNADPGYTIPDENLTAFGTGQSVTYPAGTLAMANTGAAHSGGGQFFLVFQDTTLPPSYTPFGTITSGLNILTQLAAKGNDGSSSAGGGKPNEAVTIQSVTINQ